MNLEPPDMLNVWRGTALRVTLRPVPRPAKSSCRGSGECQTTQPRLPHSTCCCLRHFDSRQATHDPRHHMRNTFLPTLSAWALVALGVAHIAFEIVRFKTPLREAIVSGFVGKCASPEVRRTAFWFVLFGLPLVLAGHIAVRATENGGLALLRIIRSYVFVSSLFGVAAFPKSPFTASLIESVLLLLAGQGLPG